MLSSSVVVSSIASQQEVPNINPNKVLSVWNFPILLIRAWVFSVQSGFLQSKNMFNRLTGDSKLV